MSRSRRAIVSTCTVFISSGYLSIAGAQSQGIDATPTADGRSSPQSSQQSSQQSGQQSGQRFAYTYGGVTGETEQNRSYITGGVSIEEARALEAARNNYRIWVVTADRQSGAWLAGAEARVVDGRGNTILDTTIEGPYLLVDLEPGRYTVEVTMNGQTQRHNVTVGSRGTRQLMTYFKADAEVSPDMPDRQIAPVGARTEIQPGGGMAAGATQPEQASGNDVPLSQRLRQQQ